MQLLPEQYFYLRLIQHGWNGTRQNSNLQFPGESIWINMAGFVPCRNTILLQFVMAWFGFMVFNATFNDISLKSWRSVLLMEETGGSGENHLPQVTGTLYHMILYWVNLAMNRVRTHNLIGTDFTGSC